MKGARRKLHSRAGASLLFAILVFMLCILAGTAALTAAAANSGRYTHLRAEQQKYLSVSSAVRVMKDELAGKTFKASVDATQVSGAADPTYTANAGSIEDSKLSDIFSEYFNSLFESGYLSRPATPAVNVTLTISGIDGMDDVTVAVKTDEYYNITMVFSVGTDMEYQTTVVLPATVSRSSTEKTVEGTTTKWTESVEVTWLSENVTVTGLK